MSTTANSKEYSDTSDRLRASAEAMADDAKASVEEGLGQAKDVLDRVSEQAQKEIRKASDQTTTFVRENPGMAIAGAVGVGILVGLALRQRY